MTTASLLVARNGWPLDAVNPKSAVLARRLAKVRGRLAQWDREISLMDGLLRRHVGPTARVLEVASGTGFNLLELANRGYTTMGLDADASLCQLANSAAVAFELPARAVCGDGCRLPFRDGDFDAVYSRSFFEHVYDRDLAIAEQLRVLRPGGLLVIQDGNLLNPRLLFDLLVLYPLRTHGAHGGPRWLFTKGRVVENLYGYLPRGRDEDAKTPGWWRRLFRGRRDCQLIEAATSAREMYPSLPSALRPFAGACQVVAVKR